MWSLEMTLWRRSHRSLKVSEDLCIRCSYVQSDLMTSCFIDAEFVRRLEYVWTSIRTNDLLSVALPFWKINTPNPVFNFNHHAPMVV